MDAGWGALALAFLKLFGLLISVAEKRDMLDAGAKLAIAEALRKQADDLQKLDAALAETRARNDAARADGGVLDDPWRVD